jgi:hypothetical protein
MMLWTVVRQYTPGHRVRHYRAAEVTAALMRTELPEHIARRMWEGPADE